MLQDLKMGIKCLQSIFKIRDPVLNATQVPGSSDTLSLLKMGKLTSLGPDKLTIEVT